MEVHCFVVWFGFSFFVCLFCFFVFFSFFVFLYVVLVILELSLDQDGLELTDILLPLLGLKGSATYPGA